MEGAAKPRQPFARDYPTKFIKFMKKSKPGGGKARHLKPVDR